MEIVKSPSGCEAIELEADAFAFPNGHCFPSEDGQTMIYERYESIR